MFSSDTSAKEESAPDLRLRKEVSPKKMGKMMHVCAEKEMLPESDLREMEVYDAVMLDPVAGWMIWESKHPKEDYNEFSEARYHFRPVC